MSTLLSFFVLPPEISPFERRYLARVNGVALLFFALHIPAFALVAWANRTGAIAALALTSAVFGGQLIASKTLENPRPRFHGPRRSGDDHGRSPLHFGRGPTQMAMHFLFFSLVAICALFGNPMVLLAAAATLSIHHFVIWLVLPRSVFNFDASPSVVAVHASFIALEAIGRVLRRTQLLRQRDRLGESIARARRGARSEKS